MSVVKCFSFDSVEQAVQQLLGCREAAESFLSTEHTVVGEIEDGLAQAHAALGMLRSSFPAWCSAVALALTVWLSIPLCFPHPESLGRVAGLSGMRLFSQETGGSLLPTYRRVSVWLKLAMVHPVLKSAMNSSNWPKSCSTGRSFLFLALGQGTYRSEFY